MTGALALDARGMTKSYGGGVLAIDDVTLEVRAGEVHALLGQNGCGKSTLIKALTGVHNPDSGSVTIFGKTLEFPVRAPHEHGIAVIHQDIGLVDTMTALENLGINAGYGTKLLGNINLRSEATIYRSIMEKLGISIDLNALAGDLSPAERSLLAVVRAMRLMEGQTDRFLFILDEPTAALSQSEAGIVLDLMRTIADLGNGVVFVSHRLAEVTASCDRLTVMRAGRTVITADVKDVTRSDIVAHMLGRRMDQFFPNPEPFSLDDAVPLLQVDKLSGSRLHDVSFSLYPGEILGVTGLAGMGQEELPGLIGGDVRPHSGTISVAGTERRFRGSRDALKAGLAVIPGNRLRDGIWIDGSAEENLTLPILSRFSGTFGLSRTAEKEWAQERMTAVNAVPADPDRPMSSFSGGNQQKVVFAKWLQLEPTALVLDEPTQGVDPGAASDLLGEIVTAATRGAGAVVISGDYEMLSEICHRVLVLNHGRLVAELVGDELSEGAIVQACEYGADTAA